MINNRRVVLYARGTADEIAQQQQACHERAEQNSDTVVAVATDPPDGSDGWAAANTLVATGRADAILVATRAAIPRMVESVTGVIAGGRRPHRLNPI